MNRQRAARLQEAARRRALPRPGVPTVAAFVYAHLPTPAAALLPIRIGELMALADFAHGRAGHRAWQDLHDMALVARQLALVGVCPEVLPLADRVIGMLDQINFSDELARMPGAALALVRELIAHHDGQRAAASHLQFVRANEAAAALQRGTDLPDTRLREVAELRPPT